MFALLILMGVISGMLGGMGLGGGTALIPLLSLIGITQKNAQVVNIFSFVIMSFFILMFNIKNGFTKVFPAVLFSVLGVIFAVIFSSLVKDFSSDILRILFGVFLILVGITEVVLFFIKYKKNKNFSPEEPREDKEGKKDKNK